MANPMLDPPVSLSLKSVTTTQGHPQFLTVHSPLLQGYQLFKAILSCVCNTFIKMRIRKRPVTHTILQFLLNCFAAFSSLKCPGQKRMLFTEPPHTLASWMPPSPQWTAGDSWVKDKGLSKWKKRYSSPLL